MRGGSPDRWLSAARLKTLRARPGRQSRLIGLISGTSADAVDAAVVRIVRGKAHLEAYLELPYPARLRSRILAVAGGAAVGAAEIAVLDAEIGERFAAATLAAVRRAKGPVDAVGSHGQTVFHAPQGRPSVTMQLGDPFIIAERTGLTVVADFRRRDVAAGGEGAPLTPMAHLELFHRAARAGKGKRRGLLVQNLGGIGNVTLVPSSGRPEEVIAFDTGPANMVLDGLIRLYTSDRKHYDRDGAMSRRGEVDERLLRLLLRHDFFRRPPPKSTGRELFGRGYVAALMGEGRRRGLAPEDLLATAAELTARSIAEAYRRFIVPRSKVEECLLCGGGVHNRDLVGRIARALRPLGIYVKSTAEHGVDPDSVEAMAFALLAWETLSGRSGNVARATGAKGPRVLGAIIPGKPG